MVIEYGFDVFFFLSSEIMIPCLHKVTSNCFLLTTLNHSLEQHLYPPYLDNFSSHNQMILIYCFSKYSILFCLCSVWIKDIRFSVDHYLFFLESFESSYLLQDTRSFPHRQICCFQRVLKTLSYAFTKCKTSKRGEKLD